MEVLFLILGIFVCLHILRFSFKWLDGDYVSLKPLVRRCQECQEPVPRVLKNCFFCDSCILKAMDDGYTIDTVMGSIGASKFVLKKWHERRNTEALVSDIRRLLNKEPSLKEDFPGIAKRFDLNWYEANVLTRKALEKEVDIASSTSVPRQL